MARALDTAKDYANKAKNRASEYLPDDSHREGGLARPLENFTARLPSDTWLWLAYGSIATSITFKILGRERDANFVGLWAPVFLIHGVYNKLVKQLGHDKYDGQRRD